MLRISGHWNCCLSFMLLLGQLWVCEWSLVVRSYLFLVLCSLWSVSWRVFTCVWCANSVSLTQKIPVASWSLLQTSTYIWSSGGSSGRRTMMPKEQKRVVIHHDSTSSWVSLGIGRTRTGCELKFKEVEVGWGWKKICFSLVLTQSLFGLHFVHLCKNLVR